MQRALKFLSCCVKSCKSEIGNFFHLSEPMITKTVELRDGNTKGYNIKTRLAKQTVCRTEKKYKRLKTVEGLVQFRKKLQLKCEAVKEPKVEYYTEKILQCENDRKKLQIHLNKLMGKDALTEILPQISDDAVLAESFKEFFLKKVHHLSGTFTNTEDYKNALQPVFTMESFEAFHNVSKADIFKILNKINRFNYPGDPFDVKNNKFQSDERFPSALSI